MKKNKFALDFEKPLRLLEEQLNNLKKTAKDHSVDVSNEMKSLEATIEQAKKTVYSNLTAWQRIQLARHPERPYSLDYIERIFTDFQELHGDRLYQDDQAIIGGPAFFDGTPVMIIAQQKGRNTKENLKRNFGYANPEGYRKALRLMKMAQKFQMPIVALIDTPGAYPGIEAEERHVAEAIAVNIRDMSQLDVPIIAVILGEGGSGGALGIAVADRVLIMQNAYYSVIAPESCAMILWKDRSFVQEAAEALKITSDKLLELGIVDKIISEPFCGAQTNYDEAAKSLKQAIQEELSVLKEKDLDTLKEERYQKYRKMGVFQA